MNKLNISSRIYSCSLLMFSVFYYRGGFPKGGGVQGDVHHPYCCPSPPWRKLWYSIFELRILLTILKWLIFEHSSINTPGHHIKSTLTNECSAHNAGNGIQISNIQRVPCLFNKTCYLSLAFSFTPLRVPHSIPLKVEKTQFGQSER